MFLTTFKYTSEHNIAISTIGLVPTGYLLYILALLCLPVRLKFIQKSMQHSKAIIFLSYIKPRANKHAHAIVVDDRRERKVNTYGLQQTINYF